jgi:phosphoribosylformimino-5-aminoimidazole carboxamide ribotide isomerase
MILYPAIDLMDGRVVRLHKGAFDAKTDYGDDPAAVAEGFKAAGADWVHVVDLSGAQAGERRQTGLIEAVAATGLKVQTGGGVRSAADIDALREAGVSRVVIGSLAVTEPEKVRAWLKFYGGEAIALALDVRTEGGHARPALKGWTETAETTLDDVIAEYADAGLAHALVTDIGRDGAMTGPNLALYEGLAQRWPNVAWQASGGVSGLADILALSLSGVSGAIAGKAIYEKRLDVAEAVRCLQSA